MSRRKANKNSGRFAAIVTKIGWSVALLLFMGVLFGGGYYLGFVSGEQESTAHYAKERQQLVKRIRQLERLQQQAAQQPVQTPKEPQATIERDTGEHVGTATHEYSDAVSLKTPPEGPLRKPKLIVERPRLAIIIDDVAFEHDVRAIRSVKLPLTMSFLPPSERHPDSARLASAEPYYMVHLPLEAMNFRSEEPFTLRSGDSQEIIMQRVHELKKLFPKVQYINNHTGSAFTADELAMNRLVFALRKEGIDFIDSRTTAQTAVPTVMENYGLPYIARDVFLDHDSDIEAIKRQIRLAIDKAKKHGSAIAIGHPHKQTIEALKQMQHLFSDVDVVRIDKLM